MKKFPLIALIVLTTAGIITFMMLTTSGSKLDQYTETHSYKHQNGYVPDSETAIKIAEAAWFPIYGENIFKMKPFTAKLIDGVWHVRGTLQKLVLKGTPVAEISNDTGEILNVGHEQ